MIRSARERTGLSLSTVLEDVTSLSVHRFSTCVPDRYIKLNIYIRRYRTRYSLRPPFFTNHLVAWHTSSRRILGTQLRLVTGDPVSKRSWDRSDHHWTEYLIIRFNASIFADALLQECLEHYLQA